MGLVIEAVPSPELPVPNPALPVLDPMLSVDTTLPEALVKFGSVCVQEGTDDAADGVNEGFQELLEGL
jgi:hypothetical protein